VLKQDRINKIENIMSDKSLSKKVKDELLKVETEKIETKLRRIEEQRQYREHLNKKE